MSKDVAAPSENLPSNVIDFEAEAGKGFENVDKESLAIPFLSVLQKGSAQVDEEDGEYIEGAKPGMFYNTVTGELFDGKEGVTFIPAAYSRRFIHWGARGSQESGYKGDMTPEEAAAAVQRGEVIKVEQRLYYPGPGGEVNDKCATLVDTRNHFGVVITKKGDCMPCLLSLSSTQIKSSKRLMTICENARIAGRDGNKIKPPLYANKLHLTTFGESNDKGSWHAIKVASDGIVDPSNPLDVEAFNMAKDFHNTVMAGEANVNYAAAADKETDDIAF